MHKKVLIKQTRKEAFPTRGGNDRTEERLCALECSIEAHTKQITTLTKQGAKIMATLAEVKAEIAKVKQTIVEEKAEVHTKLNELAAEIQALKDQIANGTVVTATDLDELIASVKEIDTAVEDISEPVVEP